jgi:DNA-dependent RNA polymerase auxiliary subunit epsilon
MNKIQEDEEAKLYETIRYQAEIVKVPARKKTSSTYIGIEIVFRVLQVLDSEWL